MRKNTYSLVAILACVMVGFGSLVDAQQDKILRRRVDFTGLTEEQKASIHIGDIQSGEVVTIRVELKIPKYLSLSRTSASCKCVVSSEEVIRTRQNDETVLKVTLHKFRLGTFTERVFVVFNNTANSSSEKGRRLVGEIELHGFVVSGDEEYFTIPSVLQLRYTPNGKHQQTLRLARLDEEPFEVKDVKTTAPWIRCSLNSMRSTERLKRVSVLIKFSELDTSQVEDAPGGYTEFVLVIDKAGNIVSKVPIRVDFLSKPRIWPDTFFFDRGKKSTSVSVDVLGADHVKSVALEASQPIAATKIVKLRGGHFRVFIEIPIGFENAPDHSVTYSLQVNHERGSDAYEITLCSSPK